jgi:hypothetical protein
LSVQSNQSTSNWAQGRAGVRVAAFPPVLLVTRIDRLARSIGDLQDTVRTVRARGRAEKFALAP